MGLKKKLLAVTLGIAGLFSVAACSNNTQESVIYYSYATGSARSAITQVADELGYLKEEGVTLKYVNIGFTEGTRRLPLVCNPRWNSFGTPPMPISATPPTSWWSTPRTTARP